MKTTNWKLLIEEVAKELGVLETAVISVNSITIDDRGKDGRAQVDVTKGKTPGNLLTTVNQKGTMSILPGGKLKKDLETLFPKKSSSAVPNSARGRSALTSGGNATKVVKGSINSKAPKTLTSDKWPSGKYVVVDGSCPNNDDMKPYFYRGCLIEDQKIVHRGSKPWILASPASVEGNNNIAEFLALVEGLKWAVKEDVEKVYSDSKTAIAWVRDGRVDGSGKKHSYVVSGSYDIASKACDATVQRVKEALEWLKLHDAQKKEGVATPKWWNKEKTEKEKALGENPADYKG